MEVLTVLAGAAGVVLIVLTVGYWTSIRGKSDWWSVPAVVLCCVWIVSCSMLMTPVLDPIWTKILEHKVKVQWEVKP